MEKNHELREEVSHLVGLYHRGILGPTAMWLPIAEALAPENAMEILDSLSPETRTQLLDVFLDRPPHVYIQKSPPASGDSAEDKDFQAVCVQIVFWCQANGPPPFVPTEPDGLTRVWVHNGAVQEWRPWEGKKTT